MRMFLDTANSQAIKKWLQTRLIDGVTTNPSLLSKEGKDPKKRILELCQMFPDGEVSVEVTEKDPAAVYKQAKEIASLARNIIVKIPCHVDYYGTIRQLVEEDVKLNITLVFSLIQGYMMAKLDVLYISPFLGRWDDIDVEGVDLIAQLRHMIDLYGFDTEILAASLRSVRHFHKVLLSGADVATLPVAVLEKAVNHPLTDKGIAKFDADWAKLGIKQFP